MMNKIFETYGVDSKTGMLSTLIQGGSDTTIYIIALYFSSIKMKKTGHSILVGILTDLAMFLMAFVVLKNKLFYCLHKMTNFGIIYLHKLII